MISAGNDIVALKSINIARTKQLNFYKKIISASEKDLYDSTFQEDIPFENFVWLLWSIKEAFYKYFQQIITDLIFSPTKITIGKLERPLPGSILKFEGCGFDHIPVFKSIVQSGDHVIHGRSIITNDFIFSVVNNTDNFENTLWGIQLISSSEPEHQSDAVRVFLLNRLKNVFPDSNLQISKSPYGYPILLKDESDIAIPVSLAHHGQYVAYSLQIKK